MTTLWVILNDDKTEIVKLFETGGSNSMPYWDIFFAHKQGNVFCRKTDKIMRFNRPTTVVTKWYVNYFHWKDQSRWGYGDPDGIGWSACLAIPEALKMLEFLE